MKECVIIIPIYKETFEDTEEIALKQCFKVIKDFDIFFITKHGLYNEWFKYANGVKYYDPSVFTNRDSYSRFMLNSIIYKDFDDYEYMLIYQLDAFIFYDNIYYFCQLGYDYYGAPWIPGTVAHTPIDSKLLYVGNGGFSLRKISTFINWTKDYAKTIDEVFLYLSKAEDLVIAYIGGLNIAPVDVAKEFAVEMNAAYIVNEIKKYPMGCHNVEKYDSYWWNNTLVDFGYKSNSTKKTSISNVRYLEERVWCRGNFNECFKERMSRIVSDKRGIYIWGTGNYGIKLMSICIRNNIKIIGFVDSMKKTNNFFSYPIIEKKQFFQIKGDDIVIISMMNPKDVEQELIDNGFIVGQDYVTYEMILQSILRNNKNMDNNMF